MDHLKRLMQRFPVLIDMEGELMRAVMEAARRIAIILLGS